MRHEQAIPLRQLRAAALVACDMAIADYKASCWKLFGYTIFPASNLSDVTKFRTQLSLSVDVAADCVTQIKKEPTEWNSYKNSTFNAFFLRHIEELVPSIYKQVLAGAYSILFYETLFDANQKDIVLYRADRRRSTTIFRNGFRLRESLADMPYRLDACRPITHDYGVSTSRHMLQAAKYAGNVYTIKYADVSQLVDPRSMAVSVSYTASFLGHKKNRIELGEVNCLKAILPQFIFSVVTRRGKGEITYNPAYTGTYEPKFPLLSPVAAPVPPSDSRGAAASGLFAPAVSGPAAASAQTDALAVHAHEVAADMEPAPAKRRRH